MSLENMIYSRYLALGTTGLIALTVFLFILRVAPKAIEAFKNAKKDELETKKEQHKEIMEMFREITKISATSADTLKRATEALERQGKTDESMMVVLKDLRQSRKEELASQRDQHKLTMEMYERILKIATESGKSVRFIKKETV